jgi:hypothetical protein
MLSGMSGLKTVEWGAHRVASTSAFARRPSRSRERSPETTHAEARVGGGDLHVRMHRAVFVSRTTAGR